jgi:hypothetical protein
MFTGNAAAPSRPITMSADRLFKKAPSTPSLPQVAGGPRVKGTLHLHGSTAVVLDSQVSAPELRGHRGNVTDLECRKPS